MNAVNAGELLLESTRFVALDQFSLLPVLQADVLLSDPDSALWPIARPDLRRC